LCPVKNHVVYTKLLEIHIDINAFNMAELMGFKVPESDIYFYKKELKKVIAKYL